MANTLSNEAALVAEGKQLDVCFAGAPARLYRNTIELDAQAVADTITLNKLPEGQLVGFQISGPTLGTSKIKVGTATDDDLYRAEATCTKPEYTALGGASEGATPIVTISTAALPGSGTLYVDFFLADV